MKSKRAKELLKQAEAKNEEVRQIFDAEDAEREKDANHSMSADEREKVKDLNKEIEEFEQQAADLELLESGRDLVAERKRRYEQPDGFVHPAAGERGRSAKTVGEAFVDSPEWAAFKAKHPGGVPDGVKFTSDPVQVKSLLPPRKLLTGASATSAGALVVPDRQPDIMRIPFPEVSIFDVISRRTTDSDLVEYVRQTSRTAAAAPVGEATDVGGTTGTKPESTFALLVVQEPVKSIAHWIAATRRALFDAGQLRGMIDDELTEGLRDVLADQMLNGSGIGENFTGLANVAGLTAQAFVDDILATTRKARTAARTTGRVRPTAYLMHPVDWEAIELEKDAELRYYFGGPSVLTAPRLWGLPVVEEEKVDEGTSYTGDLTLLTLWDRQQATIYTTDSHGELFIRNIVVILGEQRAAFGVRRPAGIVEISLAA